MTQGTNGVAIGTKHQQHQHKNRREKRERNKKSPWFCETSINSTLYSFSSTYTFFNVHILFHVSLSVYTYIPAEIRCVYKKKDKLSCWIYIRNALVNSKFKLYKSRIDCAGFFSALKSLCTFEFQSIPIPNDISLYTFGKCLCDKFWVDNINLQENASG